MNNTLITERNETMKHEYRLSHGGRENHLDIKYKKDRTNDCAIRALAHGLGRGYGTVRDEVFNLASKMWRMPNDDVVIEEYMKIQGYERKSPLTNGREGYRASKYSVGDFPLNGTIVIRCSRHWTCLKDGEILDTWDCRKKKAQSYYVIKGGQS